MEQAGAFVAQRRVQVIGAGLALSVLIGFVGGSKIGHFDWALFATVGAAFGTTALAYVTWELADLTRRDQAERERPVVIVHATSFASSGDGRGSLQVWLRNVGLGPALRVEVSATYADSTPSDVAVVGTTIPAIAPGETAHYTLEVSWTVFLDSDTKVPRSDGFPIEGEYIDRSLERNKEYPIIAHWDAPAK